MEGIWRDGSSSHVPRSGSKEAIVAIIQPPLHCLFVVRNALFLEVEVQRHGYGRDTGPLAPAIWRIIVGSLVGFHDVGRFLFSLDQELISGVVPMERPLDAEHRVIRKR